MEVRLNSGLGSFQYTGLIIIIEQSFCVEDKIGDEILQIRDDRLDKIKAPSHAPQEIRTLLLHLVQLR
jgi:hypothetical protein